MKPSKLIIAVLVVLLFGVAAYAAWVTSQSRELISRTNQPTPAQNDGSTATPDVLLPCQTGQLSAESHLSQGGGAAGSIYGVLTLVNESKTACTLNGYPGVSLVDEAGTQVGEAAERIDGTPKSMTLEPGKGASATLRFVQNNFDSGVCKDGAVNLKIYPPNQTSAVTTATPHDEWCPGFQVGPLAPLNETN